MSIKSNYNKEVKKSLNKFSSSFLEEEGLIGWEDGLPTFRQTKEAALNEGDGVGINCNGEKAAESHFKP